MAASVFVSGEKAFDVSIGVAQLRLANLAQGGRLKAASKVAYQGGIDHLVRAGPFGDLPGASRLVRVQFVDPVYRDGSMTVGLRWEAIGMAGGLFPRAGCGHQAQWQERPGQPDGADRVVPASARGSGRGIGSPSLA
jgi:hypothetical protein